MPSTPMALLVYTAPTPTYTYPIYYYTEAAAQPMAGAHIPDPPLAGPPPYLERRTVPYSTLDRPRTERTTLRSPRPCRSTASTAQTWLPRTRARLPRRGDGT